MQRIIIMIGLLVGSVAVGWAAQQTLISGQDWGTTRTIINANDTELYGHQGTTTGNPHNVTAADVGLGSVDNTSDADKPISTATQAALDLKPDTDTNTQLSEAEVDAFVGNNGYAADSHNHTGTYEPADAAIQTHIADTADHLSTDERAALTAANLPSGTNALATMDDIAAAGGGDMLKSVYDSNTDNLIDDAAIAATLARDSELPTLTSDLTNDSGFITGYTETDPTVDTSAEIVTIINTTPSTLISETAIAADIARDSELNTFDPATPGEIGGTTPAAGHFTSLTADTFDFGTPPAGETGEMYVPEDPNNGTNVVGFKAPASLLADLLWVLPSVDGTNGQVWATNGTATLGWVANYLTEAEVDAYADNNGYLTSYTETDPTVDTSAEVVTIINTTPSTLISETAIAADIARDSELPTLTSDLTNDSGFITTQTDDQTATEVPFTPNGSIAATNVQLAIQEVRDEAGGGGAWGTITGTLSDQTDLQTALDGKLADPPAMTYEDGMRPEYDWATGNIIYSHSLESLTAGYGIDVTPNGLGNSYQVDVAPADIDIDALGNVTITTPAADEILKYNGSAWVNSAASGGGTWGSITGTLSAQTDLQSALDLKLDAASAFDPASPGDIGATTPAAGNFTALTATSFDFGSPPTGETGEMALLEDPANGTNSVTLKAAADIAADVVWTLPAADGAADQTMITDGLGTLSFAANHLTEAEVDAYADNNGYLTAYTETDPTVDTSAEVVTIINTAPSTLIAESAIAADIARDNEVQSIGGIVVMAGDIVAFNTDIVTLW